MLRTIFDMLSGKAAPPYYLPKNFLRTGFGLNADPFTTLTPHDISDYPVLLDIQNEIFRTFSFGGFRPMVKQISALSTDRASAIGFEYAFQLRTSHPKVVFAINSAPLDMFMTMDKPVCFLMEGEHDRQGLKIDRLHLPHFDAARGDKWKYWNPDLNDNDVKRALYYAELCASDLGDGAAIDSKENMRLAELVDRHRIEFNFDEMRIPRHCGNLNAPSKTYS